MKRGSLRIPCSIIRGGTSKGIFFHKDDLPSDSKERELCVLRAFGSPDIRQIDGLGGANSLTSKVAILSRSEKYPETVEYTFGQVAVDKKVIDWRGNCGNLSSAVGVYALENKIVEAVDPVTVVKVHNTNTDKMLYITVQVEGGEPLLEGDFSIPGVPFPGAKILVEFECPEGSVTKKLLPTGQPLDSLEIPGKGKFAYSFVDAGNPVIFLLAEELGLKGTELPEEVEKMPETLLLIEEIRARIAEKTGIVEDYREAAKISPAIPKIGFVSPVQNYRASDGVEISAGTIDLTARLASMQKMHRAYMVSGAVCTAAAARIPGTLVSHVLREEARSAEEIRIGHPYGSMSVSIKVESEPEFKVLRAGVYRTARKILDGFVYVPLADYQ